MKIKELFEAKLGPDEQWASKVKDIPAKIQELKKQLADEEKKYKDNKDFTHSDNRKKQAEIDFITRDEDAGYEMVIARIKKQIATLEKMRK